jgi:hypothetical protein
VFPSTRPPAAASKLKVACFPKTVTGGTAHTSAVTVSDAYGNVVTGYTGTVKFSSSDKAAVLPPSYTFTAADKGVHTFSATLNTVGTQSITATDSGNASITGSETGIKVSATAVAGRVRRPKGWRARALGRLRRGADPLALVVSATPRP